MPIYLKIEGITSVNSDGNTEPATIELNSFQWGVGRGINSGAGGGGGAGKVRFSEFHVTKLTDKASPQFFQACVSGKHLGTGMVYLLPAVQTGANPPLWKYTFTDVLVTSFDNAGNRGGGDLPLETLAIEFHEITIQVP